MRDNNATGQDGWSAGSWGKDEGKNVEGVATGHGGWGEGSWGEGEDVKAVGDACVVPGTTVAREGEGEDVAEAEPQESAESDAEGYVKVQLETTAPDQRAQVHRELGARLSRGDRGPNSGGGGRFRHVGRGAGLAMEYRACQQAVARGVAST